MIRRSAAGPGEKLGQSLCQRLGKTLSKLWRREDGTATIEFTIFVPITIFIFMASMEAGFFMVRHVMMERGLDIVMREFRLGRLVRLDQDQLRGHICANMAMLQDCDSHLKVWIQPINTDVAPWPIPTNEVYCADRNGELNSPPLLSNADQGQGDEIVLVRICALEKPMFPTTGLAVKMRADSQSGYYELATATFVVTEPR